MRYEILHMRVTTIAIFFLLCACASARICGSVKVVNDLSTFESQLRNCTILIGSLKIYLVETINSEEAAKYSFPELVEVQGFMFFFNVAGITTLNTWFPNLRIIRGQEQFEKASLIIFYLPDLLEIGLKNLRLIERGDVRIGDCEKLCYAKTIDWKALGAVEKIKNQTTGYNCGDCKKWCPDGHCWGEQVCQNMTFNECPKFEYDNECVDKCPNNTVSLKGEKVCITEEECRSMDRRFTEKSWFIYDGNCTYSCPTQHMLVNKSCIYCGEHCSISCEGGEISTEADLDRYINCNLIVGNLILRISDEKTYVQLPKYLGEIREISKTLKIHRSPAIKNLEFFRKLRKIGSENMSANNSFVALDNNNLEMLWDLKNFSLVVENGGIMFHYNHKLCLSKIKEFARSIGKEFTDLEVSPTSNGDQAICEPTNSKVKIVKINSKNVTLKWEVENATSSEGYFVYYKETNKIETGNCGDDWNVVVGKANELVMLTNLKPFMNYSYYFMMNSNSSHPYSKTQMFYLKTLPDDPPEPTNVRAFSERYNQMTLTWQNPKTPGGILKHYIINYYMEPDNKSFMDQRNYCKSELTYSHNKYLPVPTESPASEKACICFDDLYLCSVAGLDKRVFDSNNCENVLKQRNFIIQNVTDDTLDKLRKEHRIKRDGFSNPVIVDAVNTRTVITDLEPFRIYIFLVSVCNENVNNTESCSPIQMVYNRTLPQPNADDIHNFTVEVKNRQLLLKWKEPPAPNSVIVSYDIWYRVNEEALPLDCVSRADHERNNFVHVINIFKSGEHAMRVRANSLAGAGRYSELVKKTITEEKVDLVLIILLCVLVMIVCFILGIYLYYRWKKKKEFEQMYLITSVNPEYAGITYTPDEWEIPRADVEILREIGQGSFGMVFSGFIKSQKIPCAVKTISDDASIDRHMEFLNEASMMKSFSCAHHVVKLLGVVSQCKPPLVVMELMECGDLKSFLRKSRDSSHAITNNEMYRMAVEIADGMAYLSAKKFVHRDLAARNCMVSGDHTIKIGDFGMTRDIYQSDYYRKDSRGFFPVRWMAPESLADGVFSSDSDVWSYGVVLWEMSTLAEQPYQGLANEQVLQFIINRGTLQRPPDCSDLLYEIMHVCWRYKPSQRPQFIDIVNKLQNFVGEDFKLVSYYHNRDREEYRIKEKTNNPAMLYAHYDISGDDVSIYNDD